ncbi:MAG: hypothetical protein RBR86_08735 [Pseudobdellovibrionaceae bacterium]|jgi:hypothetical protein|nr:hypothetical protein [Pseudobdellovibrionaceae bacterium]
MSNIIFVPGLQGVNQIAENATRSVTLARGVNEQAIYDATHKAGWAFHKISYQTPETPAPRLSVMEKSVAQQISGIFDLTRGPNIIVGSSVGFGVVVGAISRLKNSTSRFGLIGFKPIPDPLMAIEFQLKSQNFLDVLRHGIVPSIPMPVEGTGKDFFPLTKEHIDDSDALRLLSAPRSAAEFNSSAKGKIRDCKLIFARRDHLTRAFLLADFREVIPCHRARSIIKSGDHSTDLSAVLAKEVSAMIARLG